MEMDDVFCENDSKVPIKPPRKDGDDPRKPPRDNKLLSFNLPPESYDRFCTLLRYIVDLIQYVLQSYAHKGWEPDPAWGLPDLQDASELFRQDIGDAIIRYRNGMDKAFYNQMSRLNRDELLNPKSHRALQNFVYQIVHNIFENVRTQRDIFHSFLPYLAFIVDVTVYLLRYHSLFRLNYLITTIIYVFEKYIKRPFEDDEYSFFFGFYSFVESEHPLFVRPEDSVNLMGPLQHEPGFEGFEPHPPLSRIEDLFEPREPRNEAVESPKSPDHAIMEDIPFIRIPNLIESLPSSPLPPLIDDSQEINPDFRVANFTPPKADSDGRSNNQLSNQPDSPSSIVLDERLSLNPVVEHPSTPPHSEDLDCRVIVEQIHRESPSVIDYLYGSKSDKTSEASTKNDPEVKDSPDSPLLACAPDLIAEIKNRSRSRDSSAYEVTEPRDSPLLACASELTIEMKKLKIQSEDSSSSSVESIQYTHLVAERADSPLMACASESITNSQSQDQSSSSVESTQVTARPDSPLLACASESILNSQSQDQSSSFVESTQVTARPDSPLMACASESITNSQSQDQSSSSEESTQNAQVTARPDSPLLACAEQTDDDISDV